MTLNLKKLISLTIFAVVIALFAYYIFRNFDDFKSVALVNPLWLIPLFFTSLIISYSNGLVVKYQSEPFNIRLKFKEWFGLSIITTLYNTITPFRGGLLAKATYLKEKHNFSYMNSLATISGIYVINFFAASFIGLVTLLILYLKYQIFNIIILLILLGFFIPTLILILFAPKIPETRYKLINKFIQVANGWHIVRKQGKIVTYLSLITVFQLVINAVTLMISYHIFNIGLPFDKALFLVSISSFGILLAITPSGLGIAEAIAVFTGLIIGIAPAQSLSVAILGRVVGAIYIFILGPIFSYILLREHGKKHIKK